jgi:predicted deacylase
MDMDLCEQMTTALVRLTLHLGILRGPAPTSPPPVFLVRNLYTNFATRAGLWLPFVKLGQKVYHEQPLGEIVDAITGEVLENCLASVGGLVMSLCSKPLVNSGSLVCRIAVI